MRDGSIADLFDELSQRPPAERDRQLRERSLDPAARGLLERLLAQHDHLAASTDAGGPPRGIDFPRGIDLAVREAVGVEAFPGTPRYQLLARIGEGGHGVVYLARTTDEPALFAAVKVLRSDLDSRSALRRFEAERAALAQLDHPSIIGIQDAGITADGRPFFAMPLVHGEPLNVACERAGLSTRERLALVLQVLGGVAHAHRRGILHRDLKPGNILAEQVEGGWRVRIIDWGLARAVDTTGTPADALRTESTVGPAGTPEFMSPEQAEGGASRADARSDIWSLGAVLYLVLAGTLPFTREEVRGLSPSALARHLRERRPIAPSRAARDAAAAAAIAGDLDAIAMMALEPDPERRYQSVDALADDLRAHVEGRAIRARPESGARQLLRLARRHRAVTLAVVAIALTLVAAATVAARAAVDARASLRNAETSAQFLQDILGGLEPAIAQGKDRALLTEVLRTATTRVAEYDARDPVGAARIRLALAKAWFELGLRADAVAVAVRGVELAEPLVAPTDPVLRELLLIGARAADAVDDHARFREYAARLFASGTRAPGFALPVDPESCTVLARALEPLHVPVVEDGAIRLERLDYTGPDAPEVERRFARDSAEVVAHLERALGADSTQAVEARLVLLRLGLDHEPRGAGVPAILREVDRIAGRAELTVLRTRAMSMVLLGHMLAGRPAEGVAYADRVLPEVTATLGPAHPVVLNIRYNRATGLGSLGRDAEALAEFLSLVRGQRRASGVHSPRSEWTERYILEALDMAGTPRQAREYLDGYLADCAAEGEGPRREAEIRARLRRLLPETDAR